MYSPNRCCEHDNGDSVEHFSSWDAWTFVAPSFVLRGLALNFFSLFDAEVASMFINENHYVASNSQCIKRVIVKNTFTIFKVNSNGIFCRRFVGALFQLDDIKSNILALLYFVNRYK